MPKKSYEQLMQELEQAKRELAQKEKPQSLGDTLMQEMQSLGRTQAPAGGLPVKDIDDHKNIKLYTQLNKVIEVNPHNAENTMKRFYAAGFPLFTKPRTPEEVEEYKNSDIGREREAKRQSEYQRKKSKSRQGRINELAKIVATETGKAVSNVVLSKKD